MHFYFTSPLKGNELTFSIYNLVKRSFFDVVIPFIVCHTLEINSGHRDDSNTKRNIQGVEKKVT